MFRTFGEQLLAVRAAALQPHRTDARLYELNRRGVGGAAGASEAVPADGGFAVAPEFKRALVERIYADDEVLGRVFNTPMKSSSLAFPTFDEESRVDGSRFGGIRGYWENEADTATATKPKFARGELSTKKLVIFTYLTDELIQDADALGAFVEAGFKKEAQFKLVDGIVNGDGAGKPSGILSSGALITIAKDGGQGSGTLITDNVTGMWARLWPGSAQTAVWPISKTVDASLWTMNITVGDGGSAVSFYKPGQPYNTLMGRPVITIEQCQKIGTPGDIILADLSRYFLGIRQDGELAVSIHVRFLIDEQAFRFVMRVDGQTIDHTPVTPFDGSGITTSPFLCTAAR